MTFWFISNLVSLYSVRKKMLAVKSAGVDSSLADLVWVNQELDKLLEGAEFDISELTDILKSENKFFKTISGRVWKEAGREGAV